MQDNNFIKELPEEEQQVLQEHASMAPHIIFNIIRQEGEDELRRPFLALAFSALAAGIFVSFSFLFRAIFHMHMGNSQFEPMIASLGYTSGFLIVILGRMQLFTENPITTMVPLLGAWSWHRFLKVLRLWSIVFFFQHYRNSNSCCVSVESICCITKHCDCTARDRCTRNAIAGN